MEPMKKHTTWHIGGPAELFLQPESKEEAVEAIRTAARSGKPYYVIGLGSNLLVSDEGLKGTVIQLGGKLNHVLIEGNVIQADAGTPLPALAFKAGEAGLAGLAFAAGIPGSLGGALVMNAGAYGGQISDVVRKVECLNPAGEPTTLSAEECGFAYRTSRFKQEPGWVILSVTMELASGNAEELLATMQRNNASRKEKQPLEYPCAGSIFQNPPGDAAGRLVELIGAKGWREGDAQVSEKHANFIVNLGNATCKDVLTLVARVKEAVKAETGIELHEEILLLK